MNRSWIDEYNLNREHRLGRERSLLAGIAVLAAVLAVVVAVICLVPVA